MYNQQMEFWYERQLRAFQQQQEQANEKMRILFHQMPDKILEGVFEFLKSEIFKLGYLIHLNGNTKSIGVMTMMIALSNGNSFGKFDVLVPIPTRDVGGATGPHYLPRI